jgi:hypothetical protein
MPARVERIEVKCATCGAPIWLTQKLVDKAPRHFCDRQCKGKWYKLYFRGKDHPLYQGGILVQCHQCGKDVEITQVQFRNSKTGHFFCNQECMGLDRKGKPSPRNSQVEVQCAYCGKPKMVKRSHFLKKKNHFCDEDHYARWMSENQRGAKCANWRGGPVETVCSFCDRVIFVKKCHMAKSSFHFCCEECRASFRSTIRGENHPSWKGGLAEASCAYCGKPKMVLQIKARSGSNVFCDRVCQGLWNSQNRRGEANGNWRGGIAYFPYSSDFNNKLKLKIRERDHFTCQICGEKENGKAHDVHHINYDKEDSRESNLICLCQVGNACHQKTNGNREYWMKFLSKLVKKQYGYLE